MPFQPIKFYQAGSFVAGNRLLDSRTALGAGRCSARSNTLTSGTTGWRGFRRGSRCRYALDAGPCEPQNNRLIAANATGSLEVYSTPYPEVVLAAALDSWLFGNAPAAAAGIAAALRVKGPPRRSRRRPGR